MVSQAIDTIERYFSVCSADTLARSSCCSSYGPHSCWDRSRPNYLSRCQAIQSVDLGIAVLPPRARRYTSLTAHRHWLSIDLLPIAVKMAECWNSRNVAWSILCWTKRDFSDCRLAVARLANAVWLQQTGTWSKDYIWQRCGFYLPN